MITMVGTKKIETEHLILRQFELQDRDDMIVNWIADEKIQSMYAEPVYTTKEEVDGLIYQYIGQYESENACRWAIVDKKDSQCIGQIAYFQIDEKNQFAEMEYCIGNAYQRRGYATEAAKAVIQYGFDALHLHKIQICHKSINMASKRVIEKCGFIYEGTLRDYFYIDGNYVDRLYYSILEDEYKR